MSYEFELQVMSYESFVLQARVSNPFTLLKTVPVAVKIFAAGQTSITGVPSYLIYIRRIQFIRTISVNVLSV